MRPPGRNGLHVGKRTNRRAGNGSPRTAASLAGGVHFAQLSCAAAVKSRLPRLEAVHYG